MLVSVDHGNKQIKTKSSIFTSGLTKSESRPAFGEIIFYEGSYYALSEKRIPHMWDKTIDDNFFILTLFAIAKEIIAMGMYTDKEAVEIELLAGLPPAHYGAQYKNFEAYFKNRGVIKFEHEEKEFTVVIKEVATYPQAFAATMHIYNEISSLKKVFVIDIGGFTVDYLVLKQGNAILEESDSLNRGVITLYNTIKSKVIGAFGLTLDESDMDLIISGEATGYGDDVIGFIKTIVAKYVEDLFGELRERGMDLKTGKTVFVGGGSLLLKKFIQKTVSYSEPRFIENIKANLEGYETLYNLEHRGGRDE